MTFRKILSPEQIDAIRRRLQAASLGPWVYSGIVEIGGHCLPVVWSKGPQSDDERGGHVDIAWLPPEAESPNQQANAELLAAARQDIALLLDTLDAAEGRILELEARLKELLTARYSQVPGGAAPAQAGPPAGPPAGQPAGRCSASPQGSLAQAVDRARRSPGKPLHLDLADGARVDLMLQPDGLHLLLSRAGEFPTQLEWAYLLQALPGGLAAGAGPLPVQVKGRCYLKAVLSPSPDLRPGGINGD